MKQTGFLYVFLMLILIGCDFRPVVSKLIVIDSLLTAEQNDSAYRQLLLIGENSLSNEADRAYYNLLMTRASYLVNKPLDSDSLLDLATTYFQTHEDKAKLADCYYYKAVNFYKQKAYNQSILFNKKAEELAEESGNISQRFKIAEVISQLNFLTGNIPLSLDYAKKSLVLAEKGNRVEFMPYAYYRVGTAFIELGEEDSAFYYFSKIEPYIEYVRNTERPFLLSNLSLVYLDNNPEKSKKLLQESLSLKETSNSMEQLAGIFYDEGKYEEAFRLLERALTINDIAPKDNIIHNLLEYDIERGKTDKVCQRVNAIIVIKDSIINTLKNDTIYDLQTRFDHQVELNAANERLIRWQWALGGFALLIICMGCLFIWYRIRTKMQLKDRQIQIDKYIEQISDLELKKTQAELQINNLQNEKKQDEELISTILAEKENIEQEIQTLDRNIKMLAGEEVVKVRVGTKLYADLEENKTVVLWTEKDYNSLIAFYDTLNHDMVKKAYHKYKELTHRNMLYLILKEMGKTNVEICEIMALGRGGYRSMELRMRNKLKT